MSDTERLECFSWDKGHLFRIKQEGDAWMFHETLARFPASDMQPALLGAAIHTLKRAAWSWVEPANVKEEVAHADDAQ